MPNDRYHFRYRTACVRRHWPTLAAFDASWSWAAFIGKPRSMALNEPNPWQTVPYPPQPYLGGDADHYTGTSAAPGVHEVTFTADFANDAVMVDWTAPFYAGGPAGLMSPSQYTLILIDPATYDPMAATNYYWVRSIDVSGDFWGTLADPNARAAVVRGAVSDTGKLYLSAGPDTEDATIEWRYGTTLRTEPTIGVLPWIEGTVSGGETGHGTPGTFNATLTVRLPSGVGYAGSVGVSFDVYRPLPTVVTNILPQFDGQDRTRERFACGNLPDDKTVTATATGFFANSGRVDLTFDLQSYSIPGAVGIASSGYRWRLYKAIWVLGSTGLPGIGATGDAIDDQTGTAYSHELNAGDYLLQLDTTDDMGYQRRAWSSPVYILPQQIGAAWHPGGILFVAARDPADRNRVMVWKVNISTWEMTPIADAHTGVFRLCASPELWIDKTGALNFSALNYRLPLANRTQDAGYDWDFWT